MNEVMMKQRYLLWSITGIACCIILLHVFGAFFPSSANWGVHHLAFFSTPVKITVLLLMSLVLLPAVQLVVITALEKMVAAVQRAGRPLLLVLIILSTICLVFLFWTYRQKTYLLGDGFLVLRTIENQQSVEAIPQQSFADSPLVSLIAWKLQQVFASLGFNPANERAFQVLSIIVGLAFAGPLIWLARLMTNDVVEKTLIVSFVAVSGSSQLFFGYVETYAPVYVALLLFIVAGLMYLRGRVRLLVPSLIFSILFSLHFGTLLMFPALGFLFYQEVRQRRMVSAVISFLTMSICTVGILWLCGYTTHSFLEFFRRESHFVPFMGPLHSAQSYTLFSGNHFLELSNLQLLLSPFALIMSGVLFLLYGKRTVFIRREWLFVFSITICGLGFIFIFNPDLGMGRDWDLYSVFNLGTIVTVVFACCALIDNAALKRRVLVIMTSITLLHTGSWVMLNAREEQSVDRFEMMRDTSLWGTLAMKSSCEELAAMYRTRNDYQRAAEYYEEYLTFDSANSRILGNLGEMHRRLGNAEQEIYYSQRAVDFGTSIYSVYATLSAAYLRMERYDDALNVLIKGMELHAQQPKDLYNIGLLLIRTKQEYDRALQYFLQAIEMDSTFADAYLTAGTCYYNLDDSHNAQKYLLKYLSLRPDSPDSAKIKEILQSLR